MASSQVKTLSQMLLESFATEGDVTFSVGEPGQEEKIKSSVYILSVVSPVFKIMFNSTWKGHRRVINLPDIRPNVFKNFLKLLVTGDLKESHIRDLKLSVQEVFEILYVAKKYDMPFINSACTQFIKAELSVDNATLIYKCAGTWHEVDLEKSALVFIVNNAASIFQTREFLNLSRDFLSFLLKNNELNIQETTLFQSMCKWAEAQCAEKKLANTGKNLRTVLGELLFLIRFPLMSHLEMTKVVRPTQILSEKELLDLHDYIALAPTERKAAIPFVGSSRSWKPPAKETRYASRFASLQMMDGSEEEWDELDSPRKLRRVGF